MVCMMTMCVLCKRVLCKRVLFRFCSFRFLEMWDGFPPFDILRLPEVKNVEISGQVPVRPLFIHGVSENALFFTVSNVSASRTSNHIPVDGVSVYAFGDSWFCHISSNPRIFLTTVASATAFRGVGRYCTTVTPVCPKEDKNKTSLIAQIFCTLLTMTLHHSDHTTIVCNMLGIVLLFNV